MQLAQGKRLPLLIGSHPNVRHASAIDEFLQVKMTKRPRLWGGGKVSGGGFVQAHPTFSVPGFVAELGQESQRHLCAWQRGSGDFTFGAVHPLGLLVVYLIFVILGGAMLAPCLYWGAQLAAEYFDGLQSLANQPFTRFLNRSMLALAAFGLWPLTKTLHMRFWRGLGLDHARDQLQRAAIGFCMGFGSLACVALFAIAVGTRRWQFDLTAFDVVRTIVMVAATALVVAILEEVLFRGALFGILQKTFTLPAAIVLSSLAYAAVHFLDRPASPPQITWASGFQLLPAMAAGFTQRSDLIPGFVTLSIAGMILAVAYHRTGNLYCSIGLHAGWIFWLKFYRSITIGQSREGAWFWGTGKLIDGWFAVVVLAVLFALLYIRPRNDRSFGWNSIRRIRRSGVDKTPPAHAA